MNEWKTVRLGDYITEYSVKNKNCEDIPVYSVTNTQGFCTEYFSKDVSSKDKSNYKIVPRGYFAYNPSRINVGSVDWQRYEDRVIVSPLYNVFGVSNELDNQYLYYFIKSDFGNHLIKSKAEGSVRDNLKLSMLSEFPIPMPPLAEQKHIAAILDKTQKIIAEHKQMLQKYDTLIKSRFIEMFGDPTKNTKKWEIKKLGDIIRVLGGYAFSSKDFKDSGIPVLRIGNINSGVFRPSNMVFWENDETIEKYAIYPGDLVMSLTGTVGKDDYGNVCILGNDYNKYYLNQRNAKLEIVSDLDRFYLSYLLKVPEIKSRLTNISRGIRQANIANKDIESLKIPVPPITLQNDFATFVQQIDKSKSAVQKSLEKTETLYKSLMQQYFG